MKRNTLAVLSVVLVAGIVDARTSTSALGDGAEYQAMLGLSGSHEVPFTSTPPTLDGVLDAGEWDGYFHTFFGPSTLAEWAETGVGYKNNSPGNVVADGLVSQLILSEGTEAESEVNTDADSFTLTWQAWDADFLYIAVDVTDNVYDANGAPDGAFWTRDGLFIEPSFLDHRGTVADAGGTQVLIGFAAMAVEEQRFSILSQTSGLPDTGQQFIGDDPDAFLGTTHGFSLTDGGWLLETRSSWAWLTRWLENFQIGVGMEFGNSYHILDPDGGEGFGGQFQYGRDGDPSNTAGYANWTLVGGADAPSAVASTTWGSVKASFK